MEPTFFETLWKEIRLMGRLMRDPDVPFLLKLLPLVPVLYFILPIDLLPDMIPALGQVDDLTAFFLGIKAFVRLAPPHVVQRHLELMEGNVVEGEWKPADPNDEPDAKDPW